MLRSETAVQAIFAKQIFAVDDFCHLAVRKEMDAGHRGPRSLALPAVEKLNFVTAITSQQRNSG
jgi:hypothetical protein